MYSSRFKQKYPLRNAGNPVLSARLQDMRSHFFRKPDRYVALQEVYGSFSQDEWIIGS